MDQPASDLPASHYAATKRPHTALTCRLSGCTLEVIGEVDALTAPELEQALASLVGGPWHGPTAADRRLVIDLTKTRLLSAAGVTAMIRWVRSLDEATPATDRPAGVLIVPSPIAAKVLSICRFDEVAPYCRVAQAVAG